jgi:hypothetical protein
MEPHGASGRFRSCPCGSGLLSFGHATEGGGAGAGSDGAIGVGAGFGARFFVFALLAGFAFFIPFLLRAGAPRFAFLDFFATFNLPNRNYATRYHAVTAYLTCAQPFLTCALPSLIAATAVRRQNETHQVGRADGKLLGKSKTQKGLPLQPLLIRSLPIPLHRPA